MTKIDGAVKLARRIARVQYNDLSEEEVTVGKLSIMDAIGTLMAGSTLGNKCHDMVAFAKAQGGTEEASVVGYGGKLPAPLAAFANGAMVHCLDYDDYYQRCSTHPGLSNLAALLATMEYSGHTSGKEVLTAHVAAADLVYRVGASSSPKGQKEYGVFAAYANANLGATAVSGKILGLNEDEMISCMGLGYAQTCGSMQMLWESDCNLREVYPAFSSRNGVTAALLAKRGIRGIRDSLESRGGFFHLFLRGAYDPELLDVSEGDPFLITELAFKPYPACGQVFIFVDHTKALMEKYGIRAEDVDAIHLGVGPFGLSLCEPYEKRITPQLPMDAKFSIPYCVSSCLINGDVGLDSFEMDHIQDTRVTELSKKTTWTLYPEMGAKSVQEPGTVSITTTDGKTYTEEGEFPLGSVKRPMSMDQMVSKFKRCAGYCRKKLSDTEIDRLADMLLNMEKVSDMREVMRLIS